MPAPTPCPVSNIDRALSSYINSREDTLRIRRTLAKYLTASFRPVNTTTQIQHLNHEYPQNINATGTDPPGLKGMRSDYLDALRARSAAQTRYHELQAGLDDLQNRHVLEAPAETDSQYDNEVIRNRIALVRQRRSCAELQVIQDSLEKLLNANPVSSPKDPRILVIKFLGEQPDLPAERLGHISEVDDDGPLVLKVKREVLEASSAMERANSARVEAQNASRGIPPLAAQVYALSCARAQMVDWVQEELAKMEEESGFIDDVSPVKRHHEPASTLDLTSSESLIRTTYAHYTASRAAAIHSHELIQRTRSDPRSRNNHQGNGGAGNIEPEQDPPLTRVFTNMLPHLPNLARADDNERALLQQAVHLQAQINSADEETADNLSRLAGESHLLPSGSKGVEPWGKIAVENEEANEIFAQERIKDSRQEINRITAIVDLCSLQSQVLTSI